MKNEMRTQHLTDAEFSRLLDGAQPGPVTETHLAFCALCREELEIVQGSLADFRTLGTGWAETEAPRYVPLPARWMEKFRLQASWSAGLATTAMTGALVFWLGFAPHPRQSPVGHGPVAVPTNAELAADNRLLLSIDDEFMEQSQPVMAGAQAPADSPHTAHRPVGTTTD